MNARLRRIKADWQKIKEEFSGHPHIQVKPLRGNPPEVYEVTYNVPGLRLDETINRPVKIHTHRAHIELHHNYPRAKPKCVMLTPVFHPNIIPAQICIGDEWAAGETIIDVIIHIGKMLQYQEYNPDSPLNVIAARWAEQNESEFPIGHVNLYQPELQIDFHTGPSPAAEEREASAPEALEIELE